VFQSRQARRKARRIFYRPNLLHFPLYALPVVIIIHGTLRTISSACQTSETQYYVKSQTIRFPDVSLAHSAKSKSNLLFPPRYSSGSRTGQRSKERKYGMRERPAILAAWKLNCEVHHDHIFSNADV